MPTITALVALISGAYLFLAFLTKFLNGRWWLWELISLAPTSLFVLVPIGLLIASFALGNIYLVVINFANLALTFHYSDELLILFHKYFHREKSGGGDKFSITSWNTEYWHFLPVYLRNNNWGDRKPGFEEFLGKLDGDIIHLQEAFDLYGDGLNVAEQVKKLFPDYHYYQNHEVVTLTKLDVKKVYLPEGLRYLRLDVEHDGNLFSIYNVHIPVQIRLHRHKVYTWDFWQDIKEQFHKRQIHFAALKRDLMNNPLRKVITGDFNSTSAMREMMELLENYDDAIGASRKSFWAYATIKVFGLRRWRIDYILGDKVKFVNFTKKNTLLSDHSVIKAEFII